MIETIVYYILGGFLIGAVIIAIKKGRKHEATWIKNKTMLVVSLSLLGIAMILNVSYPHEAPYGEALMTVLNIPIRFAGGFHTVGITILFLFIIALVLLSRSLKKYHGRSILIAVITVTLLPAFVIYLFQHTFATGIYAVSYTSGEAMCDFEMTEKETLHGACALPFENYSNKEVDFQVEFHEVLMYEDELPMMSLMNENAPFNVTLGEREGKTVHLEADVDVSKLEHHIEGGSTTGVDIIIKANGKKRKL